VCGCAGYPSCCGVALARPQSGRAEALLPQEGIDIVLVLDTSSSMRTPEGDENSRLGTAQGVLREFVAGRERDRLGLVTFRSRSFVLSPLTLDYSAFQALVDQADDVDLPDGTAIGLAMTDALNLLRDSTARSRTIILLSDGENNREDVQPLAAARIAEALGIRIYTIDVTGAAAPVGMHVRFRPNERELRTMAELTGGRYFSATSPDAIAEVYETIDMLERSRVGGERFADFDEFASYLLGGALGLLAAQVLLTTLVLRRMP
jgi:Ca-activated chloride channel family protein